MSSHRHSEQGLSKHMLLWNSQFVPAKKTFESEHVLFHRKAVRYSLYLLQFQLQYKLSKKQQLQITSVIGLQHIAVTLLCFVKEWSTSVLDLVYPILLFKVLLQGYVMKLKQILKLMFQVLKQLQIWNVGFEKHHKAGLLEFILSHRKPVLKYNP